jgi:hypothetical protein
MQEQKIQETVSQIQEREVGMREITRSWARGDITAQEREIAMEAMTAEIRDLRTERAAQMQADGASIPATAYALGIPASEVEPLLRAAAEAHRSLHSRTGIDCQDHSCPQNRPEPSAHRHADGFDYLPHPSVSCEDYDSRVEVADTHTEIA